MELTLTRTIFTEKSTIGTLLIHSEESLFYTLEDVDRNLYQQTPVSDILREKQLHPKQVAIPYGKYEVVMTWSNRFRRVMPLLLNVPGFEGIRIHNGNTHDHTDGCILLGLYKEVDMVTHSKMACNYFDSLIRAACEKGKVFITIKKAD